MNPSFIETVTVNIDSRFRNEPRTSSSTDFLINIPSTFQNVISAKVTSAEVPSIAHVFGTNHTTVFQVRPGPSEEDWTSTQRYQWSSIVIPPANYTRATLEALLRDEIGKALGFLQTATDITTRGFLLTIDEITGRIEMKFNFSNLDPSENDFGYKTFDINLTPVDLNAVYTQAVNEGVFDGISADDYYQKEIEIYAEAMRIYSLTTPPGTVTLRDLLGFSDFLFYAMPIYTSTGFYNLFEPRYYLLQVNDYDSVQHIMANNVLTAFAKLPIISREGHVPNVLQENDLISKGKTFEQPASIPSFKVRLLDPIGNVVNLLGQDFSFTVEIQIVRDSKYYEKYRDDYTKPADLTSPTAPPTRLRNVRFE